MNRDQKAATVVALAGTLVVLQQGLKVHAQQEQGINRLDYIPVQSGKETISGRIVYGGNPVAGADMELKMTYYNAKGGSDGYSLRASAKTDSNGRFLWNRNAIITTPLTPTTDFPKSGWRLHAYSTVIHKGNEVAIDVREKFSTYIEMEVM